MEGAKETETDFTPKRSVRRDAYLQVSLSITKFMFCVVLRIWWYVGQDSISQLMNFFILYITCLLNVIMMMYMKEEIRIENFVRIHKLQ